MNTYEDSLEATMLADQNSAPETLPPAFSFIENEPVFDPVRHLALEAPQQILTLEDFGYSTKEAAQFASPIAATSPVRMLSDEGLGWAPKHLLRSVPVSVPA